MTKSDAELMEIFSAYDLTGCAWSAAQLAGCDPKTVQRYVAMRDAGGVPSKRASPTRSIDPFLAKIEEKIERSGGKVRADVVHKDLVAMGFRGSERTTRRAVAAIKESWRAGRRRVYRPWIPEPGMWLQWDWGEGPRIAGRRTQLFCAWLAWSKFRVVLPAWDQTLGSLTACLDAALRTIGAAPTYLLTDNPRTVTVEHIAKIPVRHPQMVELGRHYGCVVHTCEPFDPESKGGVENTVKIAKADLVPTTTNLRSSYGSFAELEDACARWSEQVNHRTHRATHRLPAHMLEEERAHLHALPAEPYALALGEERLVGEDRTVRWGDVRYSVPPGHEGRKVWCRVHGDELVIVGRRAHDGPGRQQTGGAGLAELWRHQLSTPGRPRIVEAHYPDHPGGNGPRQPRPRPQTKAEERFLALGPGAEAWLIEAAATGVARIRAKMARAIELASLVGAERVDAALGLAAIHGRFGESDLASICDHLARSSATGPTSMADEKHSAQPGTASWAAVRGTPQGRTNKD
ncbi:transposase [Planomonospora sphaerica]|uniref:Transposase n=2 Tax=Planomonospora sphaerica TaxID=161355 RepID=A0A171DJC3_9ACTN|nr:IS21 family transposase [Planomonospora sphaerica]GAT68939.1 transposase [Planomonospora sphaerica]